MRSSRGWLRVLAPDFAVLFFLMHVAAALARSGRELADPGIGWHLAAGRYLLETGTLMRHDLFSFTAAGKEWLNYYWLFELGAALLAKVGGLPLYATACTLLYALVPCLLYLHIVRSGASPLAAFLVVPIVHMVLLSHALARPHVVTYLFFTILLARMDDVRTGRRPVQSLWWLPLMAALWANVHGGFMSGLAAVATVAGACAARWVVVRDPQDGRNALVFGGLFAAMALATVANPYGVRLQLQAIEHVGLESTSYFTEFRSPDFHAGGTPVVYFEALVLLLLAVVALGRGGLAWSEIALAVGTLHWALVSRRNTSLFAIAVAPFVARGITPLVATYLPRAYARWGAIGAEQDARGAWRVQVALVAVVLVSLSLAGRLPFRTTLEGPELTPGAAAFIAARPERFTRAFNTDALGGPLIWRFWPTHKVFVDDRTIVYGEDFILHDYLTVFLARPGWAGVLDRWGITAAIVASSSNCAELLRASPAWRLEYSDDKTLILFRTPEA